MTFLCVRVTNTKPTLTAGGAQGRHKAHSLVTSGSNQLQRMIGKVRGKCIIRQESSGCVWLGSLPRRPYATQNRDRLLSGMYRTAVIADIANVLRRIEKLRHLTDNRITRRRWILMGRQSCARPPVLLSEQNLPTKKGRNNGTVCRKRTGSVQIEYELISGQMVTR